ncbi:phage holin family protein [Streptomyces olivaceus]|uniref:phage holin family protein n=1 Tax=Streptomyces TaxID=1883 RepID=UPI0004CAA4E1|nr:MULTISPECIES: phage holin family protein [Streptomyces]MBF8175619.1 phage holin family protein [Streptomyces olivaceus]MBZ6101714.1 phage holin family protein [Streptomyces olivaceus]MBZ6131706.1 phage holin family protein [Streptomyces olivaceus]MBZ6142390.1 phage holin family protein [Streptomyces olivaceus]MBZ6165219.1 phage holin family protein [Streptomyces olivaceus]
MTGTMHTRPVHDENHSVGELVGQATEQLSRLVRQEVALAKMELAEKGKRAGRGGGMLGAAGAIAYVGLFALAGTAAAALSLVLPVWAAALIVTAALFLIAAVLAVTGRAQLRRAVPPKPEETLGSVRADVDQIRERAHR